MNQQQAQVELVKALKLFSEQIDYCRELAIKADFPKIRLLVDTGVLEIYAKRAIVAVEKGDKNFPQNAKFPIARRQIRKRK
jgi:hypothetical protein